LAGRASGPGFVPGLSGVLLLALAYGIVHTVVRLLASGNLGEHDPHDNLLIQTLSAGWSVEQLPLYNWLLWGLQQMLGAGVEAFLALKYGLLVAMAGFMFLIGRRVTGSALWGFVAVESLSLVYQVFWRYHESYTDLVGAMTLTLATFWCLLRVLDRGWTRDYVWLAVAVGLGLLSQTIYLLFLVALLIAVLLQTALRTRLRSANLLWLPVIAGLIVSPYAGWLLAEPARLPAFLDALLPVASPFDAGVRLGAAGDAIFKPVLVLAPYVFFLPLVFPGVLRAPARLVVAETSPDLTRLIRHTLTIEAVLLLAGALWSGWAGYPVQNLLPLFLLAIVWLTDRARRSVPTEKQIGRFFWLTVTIALVALGMRLANMFVLDPVCSKCRWGQPYAELAETMRASGFRAGTVAGEDVELVSNLRRFFPEARFVAPGVGGAMVEPVWLVGTSKRDPDESARRLLGESAGSLAVTRVHAPWQHLWRPTGYRHTDWWFAVTTTVTARSAPDPRSAPTP
jgi:hypothetical protein